MEPRRYFLSIYGVDDSEHEVTREQWVKAERSAGFYPKGGDRGQLATGGFSAGSVSGRLEWREREDDDGTQ